MATTQVHPDLGLFDFRIDNQRMNTASRSESFQLALIKARQQKDLTQAEVARRLGKPQSFVSKYESGERRLEVVEFLDVCDALSASPHDIIRSVHLP